MGLNNKLNIKKMLALLAEQDKTCFFFGYLGIACALVFANLGAAYGTAKSAVGISSLAVIDSSKIFQGLIPIIMAGILGIYGVIISVIANAQIKSAGNDFGDKKGYTFLGAGLSCGLSALAAGLAIGVAGDAGVRAYAQTDGIFVGMILILIFAEAIGLYGLIVAIIMLYNAHLIVIPSSPPCPCHRCRRPSSAHSHTHSHVERHPRPAGAPLSSLVA